jgi:hypothetical protein
MSDEADASAAIQDRFDVSLAVCAELRDFALSLTRPWRGRPLDGDNYPHDKLVAALFCRSFTTYSAAVELAQSGFGEQAAMLNRSLFEDMVDAHWICTDPQTAVQRYGDHLDHGKMLLADQVAKYPDFYPDLEIPDFEVSERERLDNLFGPHGSRSWTTLSLHDRVSAIEHHWATDEDRHNLRFFRDIPHRENNQTLHVSGYGLTTLVTAHGSDDVTFRLGPSTTMVGRALFGAWWIFGQTVGLVLDHFAVPIDDTARLELFDAGRFSPELRSSE